MLHAKIMEAKKLMMSEASLVEKMVSMSIDGLYNGNEDLLREVLIFEDRVNQIELELDDMCTGIIALHQPEAKNLRLVLMIYRINNDLERLGDQAVNIAESVGHLVRDPVVSSVPELAQMKKYALAMLKNSLDAFAREDLAQSRRVCDADDVVDKLNRKIYRQLVELIKADPHLTERYLHLLRISKNLERIGDLSTNIAEDNVYLVSGEVIKHRRNEE
ncbi:MAG: phosphate signaling complex protein PhoU [Candidatus Syntrophosphaera sp.]